MIKKKLRPKTIMTTKQFTLVFRKKLMMQMIIETFFKLQTNYL